MKRICLQSGHKGTYIGATGAPGERDWNSKIVPLIATILRQKGLEVYETGASADKDPKVTGTDWDLFLAIHYDADIYSNTGGFVDIPEPATDFSTKESARIASILRGNYFSKTGIINHPERSNANTRFYYMWKALSAKTPCVLIECGVGNRKPEDYNTLHNKINDIAGIIASAIVEALIPATPTPTPTPVVNKYEKAIKDIQAILDGIKG